MGKRPKAKIVLIGAGSAVFTQGLIADFISSDVADWEIGLCDIDAEILTAITLLAEKMVQEKGAQDRVSIASSVDRRALLPDADFVVTTIAVGKRRAWEQDVFIPRKYGIYQPVGDSVMPGGISRAQRMIPAMIDIAKDVEDLCPDAFFFNYSNPMTSIVSAIRKTTNIKAIGLCHGVIQGEYYLANLLGVDKERLTAIGAGLNHLTFLFDIRVDGKSVKNRLREIASEQLSQTKGHEYNFWNRPMGENEKPHCLDNPFSWELFLTYDAIPAVVDRHAVEFFPERFPGGAYYGHTLGVDAYSIERVIAHGDETYEDLLANAKSEVKIDEMLFNRSSGEHEQLVEIIHSILFDERRVFSANMPNQGIIQGLPDDAILELPGAAMSTGFAQLHIEGFSSALQGIIAKKLAAINLTVEAALEGNRRKWIEALLLDGAVNHRTEAEKMVDEFLKEFRIYLPQYT